MKKQDDMNRVRSLLARWVAEIQLSAARCRYDIHRDSQGEVAKLLNEIYGYQLENLDNEKKDYPGIDLGDSINHVAFQVTSRTDPGKITESLEKFVRHDAETYTAGIRFLLLSFEKVKFGGKVSKKWEKIYPAFDPEFHILSFHNLIWVCLSSDEIEVFKELQNDNERYCCWNFHWCFRRFVSRFGKKWIYCY